MKKFIYAITAIMALAAFQSCQEMDPNGTVNSSKEYGFNINVNGGKGFSDAATKSVKSGWESGDRIFLFFSGKSDYVTMTYSGGSWTASPETISGIDASGQLAAVYAPYFSGTPSYSGGSWTIASGDVYYCEDNAYYTVENNKVTAVLDMVIPGDYVQFYITGIKDTDKLTCNNVECWKDITINGSSLAVGSKTNAGTTMTGSKFSTNDNGIVFYGRLKSGTLPTDCELSVTNNGKTYERTIAGKHLTGRTAYTLGTFSTSSWSLKESRPDGALTGKFSVADDKQVYFSQGNLWADGSGNFYFETKQYYTYHSFQTKAPDDDDDKETWHQEHVTNFYWSADASKAYAESAPSGGSADDVFFTNKTHTTANVTFAVNGKNGIWRALSTEEWQYLFGNSEKRNGMYACGVTVKGVNNCVVLYPDGYSGAKVNNRDTSAYDSEEEYLAATAEGVVFLPTAGKRAGSSVNGFGVNGCYWSSPAYDGNKAYCLFFSEVAIEPSCNSLRSRSEGWSVRLVSDCN